jgi:glyoxylase-like metal-dependent hydrolase (beta-lactamase superfamily II)
MGRMEHPPQPWPVGAVERLEPLVGRVLATNAGPYTFTGTQTYVVGDSRGLAVIDPGPDDAEHIAALLAAIGDAPVLAIACTHTHRDHSPAAAPLAAATGAPIIGCAPLTLEDDGPRSDAAFDTDYQPDRILSDGEIIRLPSATLVALETPGHTSNHLCFALLETGALFTGDHVMGWSTTVVSPPDGDMGDYMNSLERLQQREDRVYYPAHGPQVDKPQQLLRGMIGHRRLREKQILRLLEDTPASIAAMVEQMYPGLDAKLLRAAGQSVLAHLLDLERRGMIARDGELFLAA